MPPKTKKPLFTPSMTIPDVAPLFGLREDVLYRLVRRGEFPVEAIHIGPRTIRFRGVDVAKALGVDYNPAS